MLRKRPRRWISLRLTAIGGGAEEIFTNLGGAWIEPSVMGDER